MLAAYRPSVLLLLFGFLFRMMDTILPPPPKHVRSAAGFVEAFAQGCGCTHLARVHKISGAYPGVPG